MLSKRVVLLVVALCCLFALTPSALFSQSTSAGSVAGLVTDSSGASVVGATITIIEKATNTARTTVSNESGRYNFASIAPGSYQIDANKAGFRVAKLSEIKVTIGITLTVDFKLEIGSIAETIEVTTTGAELQTTNSTVGTTIAGDTLQLLPNLGHDVTGLLIAQPGVTSTGQAAGAQYDQNMYQLDGGNNSNDMDGSMRDYTPTNGSVSPQSTGGAPSGVMPTPAESIEEFKVSTVNQTADFNGASGAQIQLVTKRGTNQWHGSAYEYYLGANFGANTWDNNLTGTKKVATHQNRFGAAGGGPIIPKNILGGKTYFFGNYEGLRYPLSQTFTRTVPSDLFRSGIVQIQDDNGAWEQWNLNPANGPTALCGPAMNVACDPRGLWFDPTIQNLWSKYMPHSTDTKAGDGHNTLGFTGTVSTPVKSNFGVARIDHDFGKSWHLMSSYRIYNFTRTPTVQTDIGGFFPGDTLGQIAATSQRPQKPWYLVVGLTTNITPNLTNDFHYNYLRNFWVWQTNLAPPQVAGIAGAIEIAPSSGNSESSNALIPYNVNTQSVRIRFWDGHDSYYRDDLSYIHGNHLWQIGGLVQHNWDFHTRDDNGSGTFNNPVFLVGAGESGVSIGSAFRPQTCDPNGPTDPAPVITTNCIVSTQIGKWKGFYADALGISGAQVAYTRVGKDLSLQPLGKDAFDKSTINTFNLYFSDTWHLKPTFTLNYGLGWLLETPPVEQDGKQITLVDSSDNQVNVKDYLSTRQRAALAGQIYNPALGYALVGNVGNGLKYPYHMFWGGFSPRVSAAWNPRFDSGIMGKLFGQGKTVLRGGYGRVYGRQNGVDLVLVPLLGVGLIQAVKCPGATMAGVCSGTGNSNPANAFRIGVDPNPAQLYSTGISQTLCQPFFPGLTNCDGSTAAKASDTLVLDPNFKPAHSDEFNITIQRDLGHNMTLEIGYLGRMLRDEYMNVNIDQIPTMLTLGGQTFANAYGTLYKSYCGLGTACTGTGTVPVQAFFEAALGGAVSPYCAGHGSCTQAVIDNEGNNGTGNFSSQSLYSMWNHIGTALGALGQTSSPFYHSTIGSQQATSVQMSGAFGRGNYNAAIISLTQRNWKGITVNTNFTWSRSMGTQFFSQANNGINPNNGYDFKNWGSYGPQPYDTRFIYNLQGLYQLPFHKSQHGFIGRALGGWSVAPFFYIRSGLPLYVYTDGNISDESSGQGNPSSGNIPTNAVLISPYKGGSSRHLGVPGSNGVGTNGNGVNLFADPSAVYNQFRPWILGVDGPNGGGGGPLRGQSTFNLDLTVSKDLRFTERFGMTFFSTMSNVLNHPQLTDPYLDLQDPADFGSIYPAISGNVPPFSSTAQINSPRQIEFGLRIRF